jgi:hypothetical protein
LEVEAGGLQVGGQPEQHSDIFSQIIIIRRREEKIRL